MFEDVSQVDSNAVSGVRDKAAVSAVCETRVSHMLVSPGKLASDFIIEAFKDVHTGLRTLGPPLHITVNLM